MHRRAVPEGFTFSEVAGALGVFAVSIFPLLGLISGAAVQARELLERTAASRVASAVQFAVEDLPYEQLLELAGSDGGLLFAADPEAVGLIQLPASSPDPAASWPEDGFFLASATVYPAQEDGSPIRVRVVITWPHSRRERLRDADALALPAAGRSELRLELVRRP